MKVHRNNLKNMNLSRNSLLLRRAQNKSVISAICANYCKKLHPDDPDKKVKVDEDGYPEEPTTCCMAGCANCIWLDYAEKMANYYRDGGDKAVAEINEKVTDPNIKAFLLHELRMRKLK